MSAVRVALRTSRRNLARNRSRNALIAALVALPVVALVAVSVAQASQQPTTAERLTAELGEAEARVQQVAGANDVVLQSPVDPDRSWLPAVEGAETDAPPSALDPRVPGAADAIGLAEVSVDVTGDDAHLTMDAVVGDAWDPLLAGRFAVATGRTPATAHEVMISPGAAARLGIAAGDSLTVEGERVTVVGELAQAHSPQESLFIPEGWIDTSSPNQPISWFIREALTWEDVTALNQHGTIAYSRAVAENPPAENPLEQWRSQDYVDAGPLVALALGGAILAILLAGSAFAVGLRRDQQFLGMLAVSGADRRHVVAVSVATGGWLGLLGGVGGVVAGLAIAWAVQILAQAHSEPVLNVLDGSSYWGFHVRWPLVAGAVVLAIVIGAVSAAVPAALASRRDLLASLRGASRPRIASRKWTVAGVAAFACGIAGLAAGQHGLSAQLASPGSWRTGLGYTWPAVIALSTLVALAGIVAVMPMVLAGVARLATRTALPVRLAARDAYRQSSRTVPVIVAIAVAALAVTAAASVAAQSTQATASRYVGWSPVGTLRVDLVESQDDGFAVADAGPATRAIRTVAPDATVTLLAVVPDAGLGQYGTNPPALGVSPVVPQQNRCPIYEDSSPPMSQAQVATDVRCQQWIQLTQTIGAVGHIVVGGQEELEVLLGAPASEQALAALAEGGAVALTPAYLDDGTVTLGLWDQAAGNWPDSFEAEPANTVTLDAVLEQPVPSPMNPFAIAVSPATAERVGMEPLPGVLIASTPGGFTQAQADTIGDELMRVSNAWAVLSAGAQPDADVQATWLLVTALLVLTVTASAVSIGLARADARNDDATLVAVGASPRITRFVAMWQAILTVGLAAVAGTAVGAALAWAISPVQTGAPFALPWTLIAVVVVALPLVIGLGALAFTRPARVHAYRLAA